MNGLDSMRKRYGYVADWERAWPIGMRAAFEHDETGFHVVELTMCFWDSSLLKFKLLPRSWGLFLVHQPGGTGTLHDGERAYEGWRPCVWHVDADLGGIIAMGSQTELEWRFGTWLAGIARGMGMEKEMFDKRWNAPYDRAAALLREHLLPQQMIDLSAWGKFYVRGEVNELYAIEPGNGFETCHPITRETMVSYCFHTDMWMPGDDQALAIKLMLEQGREGEEEALECARAYPVDCELRKPTWDDFAAAFGELVLY